MLAFSLAGALAAQDRIRLNQIGFHPESPKLAVAVAANSDLFYLMSADLADTVYTGTLGAPSSWPHSGETVRHIDFSEFQQAGEYRILIPGLGASYPFSIKPYVHQSLATAAMKAFYFQRASTALSAAHAGRWQRPAGHPDNQVWVHASAASPERPTNTIIAAPRGWYDAGDYNKYIVNSGISTYTILAAYENFPDYFRELELNIPESGNTIPDILDEALWNVRWMLTMQDPNDGGVYHKLTTANFSGAVMPHQATARRYVVQKSTPAALDFAAVMAQAGRIFREFEAEMPGFADSCLAAAIEAWRWARQNPNRRYSQSALNAAFDPDIKTGEYGDSNFADEFQWAAAELFISTRADSFLAAHNPLAGPFGVPWWGGVNTLGLYSLVFHRAEIGSAIDTTRAINQLLALAGRLRDHVNSSAYHVAMGVTNGDFVWGSNAIAANQGVALLQAYRLSGDTSFRDAALHNLDYLLGRNATGYSFVTGHGSKTPMHIHHRQSQSDGIADPVPGLLAGGPNPRREDGCSGYLGPERARSYVDSWCSYASNEIAINWNAPLVYLAGALEALLSPSGAPTPVAPLPDGNSSLPDGFGLLQNYPNPFNPTTRIRYALPQAGEVHLGIYNLRGQLVRTLQQTTQAPGMHTLAWHADNDAGSRVASGLYLVQLRLQTAGGRWAHSRKMMVLQ